MKKDKTYKPTIGIEVHVELKTKSKMFCGCPADHFGASANTNTCPVCLGLPGALPVPNVKAIRWTQLIGLALHCKAERESKFDRKHYFYPDLPKGYQISQYDEPLCTDGYLETTEGKVRITRVHLEEDTGKLLHTTLEGEDVTLVDFNRSGVPLVEIVTEPDVKTGTQAKEFCERLQRIVRYLAVSDCDMEKGSMRLEANISLGLDLGYKVEVKNLNSFNFVGRAIDYELQRQEKLLAAGKLPRQETRGWSEKQQKTETQRYKETAADYRYFPEPDIPPMRFTSEELAGRRAELPELPDMLESRFLKDFKVEPKYAQVLVSDSRLAEVAEAVFMEGKKHGFAPNALAIIIVNKKINLKNRTPKSLIEILKKQKSEKVQDKAMLNRWITEAISSLPQAVVDYQKGKTQAIEVLIGKVMQLSSGRADAILLKAILHKRLGGKRA
ncbi:MAG: hypothetical protein A2900_03950 [Candidatus Chisholmbacteria bacterium RIFCSPLOWO2_01_FULL_50_28]|uniref:Aspartyl/glutamyl-tRNA(Asn/Gln) amidotransferase subunit B n=1 Tax=Candidatus Chisholmbacteria bacterium RIFCSPHIGHO2_01_FULL_52_32 TaxID=1797591 RepID=A0A1G1VSM0_9BACT|nr:MAG: hypothetical protein A2786_02795 [Candidatus Chisholmbacteria bacterium RIFCSPHIGHO2_01_FULL_52_32]OGY20224.1 MAG: hypothetical protein A2900_03950 [Candidatus Chisholmbacteria bacterium RIFCSPLOWO2_01_FULL_50_28]